MKVLYLIDTLKGYGAEKSITEIAVRLKKIVPVFVHLYEGDDLKLFLNSKGIKVFSLNIKSKYGFAEAIKKIGQIIQIEKPSIIHSTLFRSDLVARKLKREYPQIPLVGSLVSNSYSSLRYSQLTHLSKLKLFSTQLRDRFSQNKVDHFISNSETIKISNSISLSIPLHKITTIYRGRELSSNFVNSDLLSAAHSFPDLTNKTCFLTVGRLQQSKGQLDLIKAFKIYHEKYPQSFLLIAGEGSFEQTLKKEIERLKLDKAIFILGYIENVKQLLERADFFIFSSYFEGLPGVVIEAILSKTPCLVSNIPEVKECFAKNGALFFPPGDPVKIFNIMERALKIEDWKEKIARSYEYACKNFDIEVISKKYESLYFELMNQHKYKR